MSTEQADTGNAPILSAPPMPEALLQRVAEQFKLLGDPMRLRILEAIRYAPNGERCVQDICTFTGAGQANVSRHLAILLQGDLVGRRKQGTSVYYSLSDPIVALLCDLVCGAIHQKMVEQAILVQVRPRI